MKSKNQQKKLNARIKDWTNMKEKYAGQYHKPGSNKK